MEIEIQLLIQKLEIFERRRKEAMQVLEKTIEKRQILEIKIEVLRKKIKDFKSKFGHISLKTTEVIN